MFYKAVGKRCTNKDCKNYGKVVGLHRTICDNKECNQQLQVIRVMNKPVIFGTLAIALLIAIFFTVKALNKNDNNIEPPIKNAQDVSEQSQEEVAETISDVFTQIVREYPEMDIDSNNQLIIRDKVFFDFDSATIKPSGEEVLTNIAAKLLSILDNDSIRQHIASIEIQGHSDNLGTNQYNDDLSYRRAQSVLEFMRIKYPALGDRYVNYFEATGYGSRYPAKSNESEEGRAYNRRITFMINTK